MDAVSFPFRNIATGYKRIEAEIAAMFHDDARLLINYVYTL